MKGTTVGYATVAMGSWGEGNFGTTQRVDFTGERAFCSYILTKVP